MANSNHLSELNFWSDNRLGDSGDVNSWQDLLLELGKRATLRSNLSGLGGSRARSKNIAALPEMARCIFLVIADQSQRCPNDVPRIDMDWKVESHFMRLPDVENQIVNEMFLFKRRAIVQMQHTFESC